MGLIILFIFSYWIHPSSLFPCYSTDSSRITRPMCQVPPSSSSPFRSPRHGTDSPRATGNGNATGERAHQSSAERRETCQNLAERWKNWSERWERHKNSAERREYHQNSTERQETHQNLAEPSADRWERLLEDLLN